MKPAPLAALAALCSAPLAARAGITILLPDALADKIWRLSDADNSLTISPSEISVWFDGTNAAGTPNFDIITSLSMRSSDQLILAGDAVQDRMYAFRDLNHDGDALDLGESWIMLSAANADGASTSQLNGIAFFPSGDILIANAGSVDGPDALYRLRDLSADADRDDPGEAPPYLVDWPGFGPGNSGFNPFELLIDSPTSGFLRSANIGFQGVWRFTDANANNRADDPGELAVWWNSATSGVPPVTGFALEPDAVRPGSLYTVVQASSNGDQVVRLRDLNNDNDANDPGEAVSTCFFTEPNLTGLDIISLPSGDVLFSDSTRRITRLHDFNSDALFTDPGERSTFFTIAGTPVQDLRLMLLLPPTSACGTADFDGDGDTATDADIEAFFACLAGTCCPTCGSADFNNDGDTATDADIESFFRVLAGGPC
jgi:hypothetical protein